MHETRCKIHDTGWMMNRMVESWLCSLRLCQMHGGMNRMSGKDRGRRSVVRGRCNR